MRYRLKLAYDGTQYHGWQIQPNGISVQEVIQTKLSQICNSPIEIMGCGRTDKGVHASEFYAHFDFEGQLPSSIVYKLNAMLPSDIVIEVCENVPDDFHVRFDATLREYHYHIDLKRNPCTQHDARYFPTQLDINLLNAAASRLIGTHDFRAFCKGLPPANNYRCTIFEAAWFAKNNQIIFRISANRFLRNMVRAIVGTSILVGTGKLSINEFETIISTGTRADAGNSVPAHGLFLTKVVYPEN